jgi:PTH1 family peptidyl-tRNA hydrolase
MAADGVFMVIGLGNPGREYARSRHNVGYEVARDFCGRHSFSLRKKRKVRSQVAVGTFAGRRVVALLPTTFMNRSGEAVAPAVAFYGVNPKDLLVVLDDVNLPLGRLRIRGRGSDGGHNGLRSVIAWLGTSDFPRLRVGIGKDESRTLTGFVLGDFTEEEEKPARAAIVRAADAVESVIAEGITVAMNRYNQSGEASPGGSGETKVGFQENVAAKIDGGPC